MKDLTVRAAEADLHPWNRSFAWSEHRDDSGPLSAEQLQRFDEFGYLLVENVFEVDRLDEVRREIDPHEKAVNNFLRDLPGGRFEVAAADRLTVTLHPSTLGTASHDLAFDSWFAGVGAALLSAPPRLYWDQAVFKHPGNEEPVPWHQDNGYAFVEPQDYLTCWIPLADATAENGCVWVVPGGHRRGTLSHWHTETGWRCLEEGTDGAHLVESPAGSVVLFSSLTPHRTGPNRTDSMRPAYIVQYAPDGARLLQGDAQSGPPLGEQLQSAPGRQELLPLH